MSIYNPKWGPNGVTQVVPVGMNPTMPYQIPGAGPVSAPAPQYPGMPYGQPQMGITRTAPQMPGMPYQIPAAGQTFGRPVAIPSAVPGSAMGAINPALGRGGLNGYNTVNPTGPVQSPVNPATNPTTPYGPVSLDGSGKGGRLVGGATNAVDKLGGVRTSNRDSFAPINTVQDMLSMFTDPNSQYMQQVANVAAQQANSRGALNSSIAAGNAQAATIQAAQPFVEMATGMQMQREQNAFQGGENALQRGFQRQQIFDQAGLENWLAENNISRQDWLNANDTQRANWLGAEETGRQDWLAGNQAQRTNWLGAEEATRTNWLENQNMSRQDWFAGNQAQRQEWLSSQSWTRDFNGALSLMPIQSAQDMLQQIMTAGLANPQVYTPDIMNGLGNFFTQNWMSIMQGMFPNAFGGGTQPRPATPPVTGGKG